MYSRDHWRPAPARWVPGPPLPNPDRRADAPRAPGEWSATPFAEIACQIGLTIPTAVLRRGWIPYHAGNPTLTALETGYTGGPWVPRAVGDTLCTLARMVLAYAPPPPLRPE
jgi:hypothetical protein